MKEFKKSDLVSGVHSVVFRNGKRAYLDASMFRITDEFGCVSLEGYDNELKHTTCNTWDILDVLESKSLWQREEKEMIKIDGVEYEKKWVKDCIDSITLGYDMPKKEEPKEEKKEFVIEYIGLKKVYELGALDYNEESNVIGDRKVEHGRYRKTEQNAEYSQKRNQRANRLEALVEELQGELGIGDSYVYFDEDHEYWRNTLLCAPYIGSVGMTEKTAVKICEMLNNEEYGLEGRG